MSHINNKLSVTLNFEIVLIHSSWFEKNSGAHTKSFIKYVGQVKSTDQRLASNGSIPDSSLAKKHQS